MEAVGDGECLLACLLSLREEFAGMMHADTSGWTQAGLLEPKYRPSPTIVGLTTKQKKPKLMAEVPVTETSRRNEGGVA